MISVFEPCFSVLNRPEGLLEEPEVAAQPARLFCQVGTHEETLEFACLLIALSLDLRASEIGPLDGEDQQG